MKKGLIILPLLVVSMASCDLSAITDLIPFWPKGDTSSSSSSSKSSSSKSSSSKSSTSSKTSSSSSSSSSSSKTSYVPGDTKTFTKVKEVSQMVNGGKYLFTCLEDGGKSMKVWDGSLSREDVMKSKGASYNTYSQTSAIGDSFSTDNSVMSNSYFVIQSNSDDTYTVILASSIDTENVYKLTCNSTPGFVTTTEANAPKQKFTLSFSGDNAEFTYDAVSIWFNKYSTSDRFTVSASSANTLPIQLFIFNE